MLFCLTVSFLTYFFLKHSYFFPSFLVWTSLFSLLLPTALCPRGREGEKEGC